MRIPASLAALAFVVIPLSFTASLLSGCLFDGSGGNPVVTGTEQPLGTFTSDSHFLIRNPVIDSYYTCNNNVPELNIDTFPPDTVRYEQKDDLLHILFGPESTSLGAKYYRLTNFDRVGTGSGIEGYWKWMGVSHRLISGVPSEEDQISWARDSEYVMERSKFGTFFLHLSGGGVSTIRDIDYARLFVADWNGLGEMDSSYVDSLRYAISVTVVDKFNVDLAGLKSGETIRISFTQKGERNYSSSKPENAPFIYANHQKSCPIEDQPAWYDAFLLQNSKIAAVAKRAFKNRLPFAKLSRSGISREELFCPL